MSKTVKQVSKFRELQVLGLLLVSLFLCGACGSSGSSGSSGGTCSGTVDAALVGNWRITSETIYFDNGLTSSVTPVSTLLELAAGGGWTFGSSTGTWCVETIVASDWTTWGIASYGPTRKLVLLNWNGGTGQGPVDETGSTIDNLWTIYSYTSDVNGAGTAWIKWSAN